MVRNAMFQKVQLASRDRFDELAQLDAAAPRSPIHPAPAMTAPAWEEALGAYWDEHESLGDRAAGALAGAAHDRRAASARGPGRSARSSTTPRATTTSRSSRRSTSTPRTRPASR